MTWYNYSKYLSKTFALLLIEDHEMIDNFLGVDTEGGGGGGGDTGHFCFCHIMRHTVMILFFYEGQVKSPILHNTRDGSEFYVPCLSHYM